MLVGWHQPGNRIAWLFLAGSVGFGTVQLGLALVASPLAPDWLQAAAYALLLFAPGLLTSTWVLLVLLFPDGTFSRPVWRQYALIALGIALIASLVEFLSMPAGRFPIEYGVAAPARLGGLLAPGRGGLPIAALDLPGLLLPAIAVVGLVDRYRRAETTVPQQIKWLLFGVCLQLAISLVFFPLLSLGGEEPPVLSLLLAPLPTLGAALAIFKYRLWEVDRLVLRTVVFGVFWIVSSAAFLGLAAMAGLAIGGTDLRLLAAVALSLMAALALQPARGRLEASIRQRIYGPRPRGYTALTRLGELAPGAQPVGQLAEMIAAVARDAVGLDWSSVWLHMEVDGRHLLRLASQARADRSHGTDYGPVDFELWGDQTDPPDLQLELELELEKVLPVAPGAVVPLEAGSDLVGYLACGQRETRSLSADDRQILGVIARQPRSCCAAAGWSRSSGSVWTSCATPANAWPQARTSSDAVSSATCMTVSSSNW
jgi:hypothetical protein